MDRLVASITYQGRRQYNQDRVLTEIINAPGGDLRLLAVLDGMGGMKAGDRASVLAGGVFLDLLTKRLTGSEPDEKSIGEALVYAVQQAHQMVSNEGRADPDKRGMGTTLVAALEYQGRFMVANVGDSRAYLWDPKGHEFKRLTRDHSVREEAVRSGTLSEEEAKNSPFGHALTQSVGSGPLPHVDIFPEPGGWFSMPEGGVLMLCSDGLLDGCNDEQILHLVAGSQSPSEAVENLVRAAYHGGSRDNISVVILAHPTYRAMTALTDPPPPIEAINNSTISPERSGASSPAPLRTPSWKILLLAAAGILLLIIFFQIFGSTSINQPAPPDSTAPQANEAGAPHGIASDPDNLPELPSAGEEMPGGTNQPPAEPPDDP